MFFEEYSFVLHCNTDENITFTTFVIIVIFIFIIISIFIRYFASENTYKIKQLISTA